MDATPRGLRVLITNRTLATRTGTELYVRDLAIGLAKRGHSPVVYSPLLGEVADEIRANTVPVTDDLRTIAEPPDVIHGHHSLETLTALMAFPAAPAIALCHSWTGWPDAPLRFPRVRRYVAVDRTCRDRLRFVEGVPDKHIRVILNSVDLTRFKPRGPLPARPKRALVFSNAAAPGHKHHPAIRDACAAAGIELEVAGAAAGTTLARPEEALDRYDLVFAKAKAALEAMSVGAAVILCDAVGAGPMVTTANLHQLRPLNFGRRALCHPVTAEFLTGEIERYDPEDAAAVSRVVRAFAGTDAMIDELCSLYEEVVDEYRSAPSCDFHAEQHAVAAYLQELAPRLFQRDIFARVFRALLRKPFVGRLIRIDATKPRRYWLSQLLRLESLD